MRKSEPDSKYFVKSLEKEILPVKINENRRKLCKLLRRRRCFENAKPRRSAGGAQLNRFLGELEGPIRDLDLRLFAKDYHISSAKSGSGEPPDRAQICPSVVDVRNRFETCFFLSRFPDHPSGILSDETRK